MRSNMYRRSCGLVLVGIASASIANSAMGQDFFSVDVDSDELVTFSASGSGTTLAPIGSLGIDVFNVELTWYDGRLFMMSAGNQGSLLGLYEICPCSGSATLLPAVHVPGEQVEYIETLASDDLGLLIGFDRSLDDGEARSNRLGRLDPDTGLVTDVVAIPSTALSDRGDLDGGVYDPNSDALLAFSGANNLTSLGNVDITTGQVVELGQILRSEIGGSILTSGSILGDSLFAIGIGSRTQLVKASRTTDSWEVTEFNEVSTTALYGIVPRGIADFADPLGCVDLADINAFVAAFTSQDPAADLNADGLFDLADIVAFVNAFAAGCP